MDLRQAKAQELADRGRVVRQGEAWLVFSLTSPNRYRVTLSPRACECPDHDLRQEDCKHLLAVEIQAAREEPPKKWPKKSYKQDWPRYTAAQVYEKEDFLHLLHDLCRDLRDQPRGRGRPRIRTSDLVYAMLLKTYTTLSVRRFMSDLRAAQRKGYVRRVPCPSAVSRGFESEELTPILRSLIVQASAPLKALESQFAADSTGFSSCKFDRWFDVRTGREVSQHCWVKAHAMVGTLTNVVVAVEVLAEYSGDAPQLPTLVRTAAENFKLTEVSADSAYNSNENHDAVAGAGGTLYSAFKSNATGGVGGLYERMYHLFGLNRDEYLQHYHRRSNVEATFSAVKRLFGDSVRSRTDTAMRNEVLAKLVCYNITCLIHAVYELDLDVDLASEPDPDAKMILKFPY